MDVFFFHTCMSSGGDQKLDIADFFIKAAALTLEVRESCHASVCSSVHVCGWCVLVACVLVCHIHVC